MPLWAAAVLFLLSIAGVVLSFRAYFRGRGKIFLAAGIASALLCAGSIVYAAAVWLFVSSVK
jgi:CHASE2 domain-containing sensor protein